MAEVGTFYQSKYTGEQLDEILKNVYDAVPLDGSKPMTAPLTIKEVENGYTQLEKNHTQTTDLGTALRDVSKGGSVVALLLKAADQAARLQFGTSVYDLIHTGNITGYVKPYADTAQAASAAAESALEGVKEAIDNIPEGVATPIVNNLTTGGTSMALSAEMGKVLKSELEGITSEDIGAIAAAVPDISGKNLADYVALGKSGIYRGANVTNAPTTDWYFFVILAGSTAYSSITAISTFTEAVYQARYGNQTIGFDWKKTATTDYAVNKAGDTMTGALGVNGGQGVVKAGGGSAQLEHYPTAGDTSTNLIFGIRAKDTLEKLARLYHTVGGNTTAYNILHTGNKPSGSYTGNGSATARTIDTGGIGNTVMITSARGMAVVTNGNCITSAGANVNGVSYSETHFVSGALYLATANTLLNESGITYFYQVL